MPSEDSGDGWFVGTEGQDGVWSMHLRHPSPLWTGPTVLMLAPLSHHLEEPLPLPVGTFADPLEHATRGGASVGQKLVFERLERVQLFVFNSLCM